MMDSEELEKEMWIFWRRVKKEKEKEKKSQFSTRNRFKKQVVYRTTKAGEFK